MVLPLRRRLQGAARRGSKLSARNLFLPAEDSMMTGSPVRLPGRSLLARTNCAMSEFGSQLYRWRRGAGLGLRTFAELIDQRASTVSAIEQGLRGPWRDPVILDRVARALGFDLDSPDYEVFRNASISSHREENHKRRLLARNASLLWHNGAADAPLDDEGIEELASFLGVAPRPQFGGDESSQAWDPLPLTDLAVEWRARRTLGRRGDPHAPGTVDVEAALEDAGWQIAVVPGLLPRFSVSACAVFNANERMTLVIDRVYADTRPLAQYRLVLAATAAPLALADGPASARAVAHAEGSRRRCAQFSLAMLLPAKVVGAAAEGVYHELCTARGAPAAEAAIRELRNRLAAMLAAPTELIDRRLAEWPCRVYDRVRLAVAAEERTLPPADWLPEWRPTRQQRLFT